VAAGKLAAHAIVAAGAAASEAILSGLNALTKLHILDEAKVLWEHLIVDLVDDSYGDGLVGRERA
jgi:hypothetical protein